MKGLQGKKIIYLITQSKYGGAQKYLLHLAKHFSQKNEVLIVVGEKKNQDPFFWQQAKALNIRIIVLEHLIRDISLVKAFEALLEIRKLLYKERPDFLHINSSMAGAVASTAAWLYRFDPLNTAIRVIYTVHGFVFNQPMKKMRRRIYLMIEKFTANFKGALITVSNYDKQQGLQHKIAPEIRMIVIHNGIDVSEMEFMTRENARLKLDIKISNTVIGTMASLYPTKGLSYLIEALKLLRDKKIQPQLVIFGDGPDYDELLKQINSYQLDKQVIILKNKPRAWPYLKAFDIFVLPSVKEGFPYALLEAAAAQLPVVTTKVGGIPELISHNETGLLVAPREPQALAQELETLIKDEKLRQNLGRNLRSRLEANFSLQNMLEQTEQVYLKFYRR